MALLLALPLALSLLGSCLCAPPGTLDVDTFDLESYDLNGEPDWENIFLNNYGDAYDYDDLNQPQIEVGTVAPPPTVPAPPQNVPPPDYVEEVTLPPRPTQAPAPPNLDFDGPGLFGPETGLGLPTCLLCVCISTSVYCDDSDIDQIPPLPKETTYFYARFNKIKHITARDFVNMNKLKRIDLTGNQISLIDQDAFRSLPELEDLLLPDNQLQGLPELPATLRHIDAKNNQLKSTGVHQDAFKDMTKLEYLYLSHNQLDYVPTPLPESLRVLHLQYNNIQSLHEDTFCNHLNPNYLRRPLEDIRLDGNPIILSRFAQAYICLPRLPVGRTH
ncbi:opticin [Megalops cyprinoides]|uniref:opticin n=1 Tax=Megalops cyprinoides TaxID=118141 RepID=UPI001864DC72|nr:opticin [Megalops cyprinoides]